MLLCNHGEISERKFNRRRINESGKREIKLSYFYSIVHDSRRVENGSEVGKDTDEKISMLLSLRMNLEKTFSVAMAFLIKIELNMFLLMHEQTFCFTSLNFAYKSVQPSCATQWEKDFKAQN